MIKILTTLIIACVVFGAGSVFGAWMAFETSIWIVLGALVVAGALVTWSIVKECSYGDAGFKYL